jgi:cyclic pyranopterin phosphate synthase
MPLLDVILGYDCNLACDYCTITPAMRERALPTEQVVREMAAARTAGYERISFTGGEPTIRRDLIALVRHAAKLGYESIKVQSNGLLYAQAANVDTLIAAGCNSFHISIHTHVADAYDDLVRRDGAYPAMVDGLRNVIASGQPLTVDVIIKTDTVDRLADCARWLHAEGVRAIDLWYVSLTDGNAGNVDSLPRMTDALPAMRDVFAFGRDHGMTIRSLHVPRCILGADASHAFDPGSQHVRVVTPEATFDLADSRLAGQTYVDACEGCSLRDICPGVRPDYVDTHGASEITAVR